MISIFKQAIAVFRMKYGSVIFGWEDGSGYIENPPDLYSISRCKLLSSNRLPSRFQSTIFSTLKGTIYSASNIHLRLFTQAASRLDKESDKEIWGLKDYSVPEEIELRHYTIFEEGH